MGHRPPPPPSPPQSISDREIAILNDERYISDFTDREIASLKERYIADFIDLDEFEEKVGNWLKWETLNPIERREFEQEIG